MNKFKSFLLVLYSKIKILLGKIKSLASKDINCFKKKRKMIKNDSNKFLFINRKVLKFAIPVSMFVLLLALFLGGRIIPEMLSGNVYRITELSDNLDMVKAGDKVNYVINGYNNWRVLSVDKENGTIDVTSNTNVSDLTLKPNQTVDEYNRIFQEEADKFKDGKYVVNARTIAKSDTLMFNTDGEFWLANVNEESLMTNMTGSMDSEQITYRDTLDSDTVYVVPVLKFRIPESQIPEKYEIINLDVGGIDKWIYMGDQTSSASPGIKLVPVYPVFPISVNISDKKNVDGTIGKYFSVFKSSLKDVTVMSDGGDWSYSYYRSDKARFLSSYGNVGRELLRYYKDNGLFDNQDYVYFSGVYNYDSGYDNYVHCNEKKYNTECQFSVYRYKSNDELNSEWGYRVSKTLTFGYRPVLTLKIDNKDVGKSTTENLSIGDHVKYNANGYKNWKVLSIDRDAGTVDVISGGIVKNIGMYGIEDYENYENILQNEVDAYKVGSVAVGARPIVDSDVGKLIDMNDNVSAMYWYNAKQNIERQSSTPWSSSVMGEISYEVGILWTNTGDYYVNDLSNTVSAPFLRRYWVRFYSVDSNSFSGRLSYYVGNGDLSYIAGLRPIITLKLDSVETYSDSQAEQIDISSHDYDSYYISEQNSNNFNDNTSSLLFRHSSDSSKTASKKINNNKLDISLNDEECDFVSDPEGTYGNIIDADLVETNEILEVAVFLSIIYGLIIIGFVILAIVYRQKKKNRFLDS